MSPPWMPLYIADYRADTAHLSASEHGGYLLLIMHYWSTGGLPDDDKQLARIACMSPQEWKRSRGTIQALFRDGWKHKRIDEELSHANEVIEKRRTAALHRYSKRPANADANAHDMQTQPPSPSPSTEHGGGDARERCLISEEARKLDTELAVLAGHSIDFVPPSWPGAAGRIQMMLSQGISAATMRTAVEKAARRKRDGPAESFAYFEKPIMREHAAQTAPLPTIVAVDKPPEVIHVRTSDPWARAAESLSARLAAAADASGIAVGELRSDAGDRAVEILPPEKRCG